MKKQLLGLILLGSLAAQGQAWKKNLPATGNFFTMQQTFTDYWKNVPNPPKGKGYKQFKRWEWYWEPRVGPSGNFPPQGAVQQAWDNYLKQVSTLRSNGVDSGNWTVMGPKTSAGGYEGLGRINCVAFHPTDSNTLYVGTPAGGLWVSTDLGATWTTSTDQNPVLGVSDIAIDPNDPTILYIATGDGDHGSLSSLTYTYAGDTKSVGILKSTDGGKTWKQTGMNWQTSQARLIRRILINPNNSMVLLAATSEGIYKSNDGGKTWGNKKTGYFMDIEYKPGDTTTVYGATYDASTANAQIYRSTNGGSTWSQVGSLSGAVRINLAVTPKNAALVHALVSDGNGGLLGLYKSTNSGSSFSQYWDGATDGNLLDWSYDASGSGGQGDYDLSIAINPNNDKEIYVGGINTWRSSDGGSTFKLNTFWVGGSQNVLNKPVVHADKHWLAFHNIRKNYLFECNDGGIYYTTNSGSTWKDITNGMVISQFYRISTAQTTGKLTIGGLQDNGSKKLSTSTWSYATGGDGMDCAIDYKNANYMYASYAKGVIYRSNDQFVNDQTTISDNISPAPTGAWVTPFCLDPKDPKIIYAGYTDVYKSTDRGDTWTQLSSNLTGGYTLRSLAVAPSNTQVIYAAKFYSIYSTTDGGNTWNDITNNLPAEAITYICVSPYDANRVWVTLSGYTAKTKVYFSKDGGANWSNYSGSLPNVPANCIIYERNKKGDLYVGTDLGIFHRDSTASDWTYFSKGLPNVVVTDLDIQYSTAKLRAGTFGRGLWESPLYDTSSNGQPSVNPPVANFKADDTTICVGTTIQFTHLSSNTPTSWKWTFTGADTVFRSDSMPKVTYNKAGQFNVKLVVSNSAGADSLTKLKYITVTAYPAKPTITQFTNLLQSSFATGCTYTWYRNGSKLSDTTQTIFANQDGYYYVQVTNAGGCASNSDSVNFLFTGINQHIISEGYTLYPNPGTTEIQLQWKEAVSENLTIQFISTDGRIALQEVVAKGTMQKALDTHALARGTYVVCIYGATQHYKPLNVALH